MLFKLSPDNRCDRKLVSELRRALIYKLLGTPRYIAKEVFEDPINEDEAKVNETDF
ncbi:MAG: hypothetical protein ACQJCO_04320 [cyanobacterium endosymbiont of Rhopalodia sterrenbergii]